MFQVRQQRQCRQHDGEHQGDPSGQNEPHHSDDAQRRPNRASRQQRFEFEIGGNYNVNPRLFVSAAYRYIDYEDEAPYLTDTSGRADFYTLGIGYRFF